MGCRKDEVVTEALKTNGRAAPDAHRSTGEGLMVYQGVGGSRVCSLLIQAIYPSGYKVRFENQLSWYNILVYGDLQVFTSFFFKFSLFTKALQMVHEVKYNFIFSI